LQSDAKRRLAKQSDRNAKHCKAMPNDAKRYKVIAMQNEAKRSEATLGEIKRHDSRHCKAMQSIDEKIRYYY
jgi:hypothetical protein